MFALLVLSEQAVWGHGEGTKWRRHCLPVRLCLVNEGRGAVGHGDARMFHLKRKRERREVEF